MPPYEALYGMNCRTPLCWSEFGERKLVSPEIEVAKEYRAAKQTIERLNRSLKANYLPMGGL